MSVTFSAEGMPAAADPEAFGGEHDVNMSNANAARVCETLGIELDPDWSGEMTAIDFLGRVVMALALAPTDEGMPSYEHITAPGSARFIEGARAPGYLQSRLGQLHKLAEWAVSNDAVVFWS